MIEYDMEDLSKKSPLDVCSLPSEHCSVMRVPVSVTLLQVRQSHADTIVLDVSVDYVGIFGHNNYMLGQNCSS